MLKFEGKNKTVKLEIWQVLGGEEMEEVSLKLDTEARKPESPECLSKHA